MKLPLQIVFFYFIANLDLVVPNVYLRQVFDNFVLFQISHILFLWFNILVLLILTWLLKGRQFIQCGYLSLFSFFLPPITLFHMFSSNRSSYNSVEMMFYFTCWLILIDMLIDTDWCWLVLTDADLCWLIIIDMLIDANWYADWYADWCLLMLIDAQERSN